MLELDKSVEIKQNGRRIWFMPNSALKWSGNCLTSEGGRIQILYLSKGTDTT